MVANISVAADSRYEGLGDDRLEFTGSVRVAKGSEFIVGDSTYRLKEGVSLDYIDWQGAGASVLFNNVLPTANKRERPRINMGPNSDLRDRTIECYALELVTDLAREFSRISHLSAEEIKELDRQDFSYLEQIFEVAK